jgi:hypothetical protein
MALRDAVELDDSGNARVVERVDLTSGKGPTPRGFPKRGGVYTKAYTSGGIHQVLVGDILTGALSSATCRVISVTLSSGTWSGGDAAGTLTVVDKNGIFVAENLNEGTNLDVCTIASGDLTATTLTAADTSDLTSLPAELTQNLITIGDKSSLVVFPEQYTSGGTVTITPILFDNETSPNVIGCLAGRLFTQPGSLRRGSASGLYIMPGQMWDCYGGYKVGLHLTAITGTSNYVQIWGYTV